MQMQFQEKGLQVLSLVAAQYMVVLTRVESLMQHK